MTKTNYKSDLNRQDAKFAKKDKESQIKQWFSNVFVFAVLGVLGALAVRLVS